jgi:hypothetical protein
MLDLLLADSTEALDPALVPRRPLVARLSGITSTHIGMSDGQREHLLPETIESAPFRPDCTDGDRQIRIHHPTTLAAILRANVRQCVVEVRMTILNRYPSNRILWD